MNEFYIPTSGGQKGPFSLTKVLDLFAAGKIPSGFKLIDAGSGLKVSIDDIIANATVPEEALLDDFDEGDAEDFYEPIEEAVPTGVQQAIKGAPKKARRSAGARGPVPTRSNASRPGRGSAARGRAGGERGGGQFHAKPSSMPMIAAGFVVILLAVGGFFLWQQQDKIGVTPYIGNWELDSAKTTGAMNSMFEKIEKTKLKEALAAGGKTDEDVKRITNQTKLGTEMGKQFMKLMIDKFAIINFQVTETQIKMSAEGEEEIKPVKFSKLSNASYKITFKDGSNAPITVKFSSPSKATFNSPGEDPIPFHWEKK